MRLSKVENLGFQWGAKPVYNGPMRPMTPALKSDTFTPSSSNLSWLKDKPIILALNELKAITFDAKDVAQLENLGLILPFRSGKEATDFITKTNIRIKFASLAAPSIHAQYDFDDNFININELYKTTQNPSEISAIAGAILHEAAHAKDQDANSSIQEELECLALNAIAHRAIMKKTTHAPTSDALIIKEGVELYSNLFFQEPSKQKLIERVKDKYGFLPVGDFKHPPSDLAYAVKESY